MPSFLDRIIAINSVVIPGLHRYWYKSIKFFLFQTLVLSKPQKLDGWQKWAIFQISAQFF